MADIWIQKKLELAPQRRGCHLITHAIEAELAADLASLRVGWLQVFIQHTSASLTINENADPDVRHDMEMALNQICSEHQHFRHTCEGPDDMPAHVKNSLLGCSLLIPIENGRLALGTWQGIYLCEHRDRGGRRRLLLTIQATETDEPRV